LKNGAGKTDIVLYFITERNVSPHLTGMDGWVALHFAAYEGVVSVFFFEKIYQSLITFFCKGHLDTTRTLCQLLPDPPRALQPQTFQKDTPLHLASIKGHTDVVRCLVEVGKVPVDVCANEEWTALHCASHRGTCLFGFYLVSITAPQLLVVCSQTHTPTHTEKKKKRK
jgi:ankyrin repeat protein